MWLKERNFNERANPGVYARGRAARRAKGFGPTADDTVDDMDTSDSLADFLRESSGDFDKYLNQVLLSANSVALPVTNH